MTRETTIQDCNGRENSLQLRLIEKLGEEGYVQQLYDFLQGKYHPDNIKVEDNEKPNLTSDQAWHIVYCLQEHFGMLDDRFEKCRDCGEIYDSYSGGTTIDSDSELRIEYDDDNNEIEKEWEESDYGNYCENCRPD